MYRFTLSFPSGHECPVLVRRGGLSELPTLWRPSWEQAAIIGDANVLARYADTVAHALQARCKEVLLLDFAPGEESKNRATKAHLETELLAARFGRQGCIVALGGGVSLDVAGFVAATYLRGVPHINVPTSLLAQVDAAIGGKTAVNTPEGKNLIGTFHQPAAVVVDPDVLATLPAAEWTHGVAEMVKHAVIADAKFFQWIDERATRLATAHTLDVHPLRRCLEIKAEVVCADEREQGRRAVLSFGHTVGHALERATAYTMAHGSAVALGMLVEATVATRRTGFPTESLTRLEDVWRRLGLPVRLATTDTPSLEDVLPFLEMDKKRAGGQVRMALPAHIGTMADPDGRHTVAVALDDVNDAWQRWMA